MDTRTTKMILYWVISSELFKIVERQDEGKKNDDMKFVDSFSNKDEARKVIDLLRDEMYDKKKTIDHVIKEYWNGQLRPNLAPQDTVTLFYDLEGKKFQLLVGTTLDLNPIEGDILEVGRFPSEDKANEVANFLQDLSDLQGTTAPTLINKYVSGTLYESFEKWYHFNESEDQEAEASPENVYIAIEIINETPKMSGSFYSPCLRSCAQEVLKEFQGIIDNINFGEYPHIKFEVEDNCFVTIPKKIITSSIVILKIVDNYPQQKATERAKRRTN